MPLYYQEEETCAFCGQVSSHTEFKKIEWTGWSDLDTRQPEPYRSHIYHYIHCCPNCGFCSTDLEYNKEAQLGLVETDAYQLQLRDPDLPVLANEYLCWAMILIEKGEPTSAERDQHEAAWICDDKMDSEAASHCRNIALNTLQKVKFLGLEIACTWADYHNNFIEEVELLRRLGRHREALVICEEGIEIEVDEIGLCVLRFERDLILQGDCKTHKVEEAFARHISDWKDRFYEPEFTMWRV